MKLTVEMNTLESKAAISKGTLLALVESVEGVEVSATEAPVAKAAEKKVDKSAKKEDPKPATTPAPEAPKEEEKPKEEDKPKDEIKPAADTKEFTLEEVRAKMTQLTQAGKQVQVKALISKYGGNRLSDIKSENYAALMAEAEGL